MGIVDKWGSGGGGRESAEEVKEQGSILPWEGPGHTPSVCLPWGVEEPACCGRRLALLAHSLSLAL